VVSRAPAGRTPVLVVPNRVVPRLGLVFDIAVSIDPTFNQTGVGRFAPAWTPQLAVTTDRSLWVAWRLDSAATQPFAAASAGPPGVDVGAASSYRIDPVALDSAALHVVTMAASLPFDLPQTGPPALRDRPQRIADAAAMNGRHPASTSITLRPDPSGLQALPAPHAGGPADS